MEGIHAGTRRWCFRTENLYNASQPCDVSFSTRRVSQIIEFPLGGLAQLSVSVRRFLEPCNNLQQRAVNRFQIYALLLIQLIIVLTYFSLQPQHPQNNLRCDASQLPE